MERKKKWIRRKTNVLYGGDASDVGDDCDDGDSLLLFAQCETRYGEKLLDLTCNESVGDTGIRVCE